MSFEKRAYMRVLLLMLVFVIVPTGAPTAKGRPPVKEEKPGLLAKAKVQPEAALTIAQSRFPSARLAAAEIEEEEGKLIYSFDFKTKGKSGIDEVTVDAVTGEVVNIEHEAPKDEAREKAKERAAEPHKGRSP